MALWLVVPANPLPSQQPGVMTETPRGMCFRARPLTDCRAFWLTEFGLAARLGSASSPDALLTMELGAMRNVGAQSALGGSLYLSLNDGAGDVGGVGVKPRIRRWLGPGIALDVSPGILLAGGGSPGFTGHVGLTVRDWLALTMQAQTVQPTNSGGRALAWFGGARLGALPGAIGAGAMLLLGTLLAVGCATSHGCGGD